MKRTAFTLVETLIAVTVLAILASVIVMASSATGTQTLESVARVLAADLRLARSLAIQYNTRYSVQFDTSNNVYEIVHTGTGNPPPLENPLTPLGEVYRVELGRMGTSTAQNNGIRLDRVALKDSRSDVTDVTFNPLGGTGPQRSEDTLIWLTDRSGSQIRAVKLTVSWVTGQTWIERVVSR